MILFIDDEEGRTTRWREALEEVAPVTAIPTAERALAAFADPEIMRQVRLVVLDMALHTTGGLTAAETGYGRLTGDVLRARLRRSGWSGPVIVLTNGRDDALRARVEADGDTYRRKSECMPTALAELARERLVAPSSSSSTRQRR